jgi:pyruvate dehydrogenase E1 component alpha subunit
MLPEEWSLFTMMLKCRLFEEAISRLWYDGLISGEMHLGTGEEAINVGVVSQLRDGDSMALDHRGTAPLIIRGVDPVKIIREVLGHPEGLCGGLGGHMHLFSKEHLAASSGIVGSAGPTAAGFALAATRLRPGAISIAFFGEGAMNQGMLLESMNLASVWKLPVLFICKDDTWSITTESASMTGGDLNIRARGLGLPVIDVDGLNVLAVWEAANEAIQNARSGQGPTFIHARCIHLEGHFLGYQMKKIVRSPLKEMSDLAGPLTKSFLKPGGARFSERMKGLKTVLSAVTANMRDSRGQSARDPVLLARKNLETDSHRLEKLEIALEKEVSILLETALTEDML